MPNWCMNKVEVRGHTAIVRQIRNRMHKKYKDPDGAEDHERRFDFQGILPMPKALRSVCSGGMHIDGKYVNQWRYVDGVAVAVTPDELAEMLVKYGSVSPLDWSIMNWGVKWNACDDRETWYDVDGGMATWGIQFETPWGPPEEVINELRLKYPEVEITCDWEEEGGGRGRV